MEVLRGLVGGQEEKVQAAGQEQLGLAGQEDRQPKQRQEWQSEGVVAVEERIAGQTIPV